MFEHVYAGRLYVDLAALDSRTNDEETPCSHKRVCAAEGVRLLVSFDKNDTEGEDLLWVSDVMFMPKASLRGSAAPKVGEAESVIRVRYHLKGAETAETAKRVYRDFFRLGDDYDFPISEEGPLRYERRDYPISVAVASRLFRFVLDKDNFSVSNLTALIESFKGYGTLPHYCAKGFTTGIGAHDVMNCITFAARFMDHLGVGLREDPFMKQYLGDTGGWRKIAYPERFLLSFANICTKIGGVAYRENISLVFNTHYYSEKDELKAVLEPSPSPGTRRNGQMVIMGDPSEDIRSLAERSFVKAEVAATAVVGMTGTAVGGGALAAGGTVAASTSAAVGVFGTVATAASSVGTTVLGAVGVTTTATAGPVLLGGALAGGAVGAVGYGGYRLVKKIGSWF